ncbi:MAG: hypothetical protein HY814_11280 [Candidatus Riflebacteria bacterium]|nr:hypothetical protein [Candidatus Riflebacteria bacterium]
MPIIHIELRRFRPAAVALLSALVLAAALVAAPAVSPAPAVFIAPVMESAGSYATESDGDRELLVFAEQPAPGEGLEAQVRAALASAPAFAIASRIYSLSHQIAAEARVPGLGPRALYIYVGDAFGPCGPAHVNRRILVRRADGSVEKPGGFIIVSDIEGGSYVLTVADLLREKYLPMTLAHEIGHRIMGDLYGPELDLAVRSVSHTGHDVMTITDPLMAMSEGWAEGLEAVVGDLLAAGKAADWGEKSTDPIVRSMFRGRQDILRRDGYIWDEVGARDGESRNGLQMIASEGVVGYQFYQVMTQADFCEKDPTVGFQKVARVLARYRPQDVGQFMSAVAREFPAHRSAVIRMLYEWTKWTLHSPRGGELYKAYRTAAWAQHRYQRKDETAQELAAETQAARKAYEEWKTIAFNEVAARAEIAPRLPDPLWLDRGFSRVALNLATAEELAAFFKELRIATADALVMAQKVTQHRDSSAGGLFGSVEALAPFIGSEKVPAVQDARVVFQNWLTNRPVPESVAAYVKQCPDRILKGRLLRWSRERSTPAAR